MISDSLDLNPVLSLRHRHRELRIETRIVVQKRALRYTKARVGSTIRFYVCRRHRRCEGGSGGRSGGPRRKEEPEGHTAVVFEEKKKQSAKSRT